MCRQQTAPHPFVLEDVSNHSVRGNVGTESLAAPQCTLKGCLQAAPLYPNSCPCPHPGIAPSSPCLQRNKFIPTSEHCTFCLLCLACSSLGSISSALSHYSTLSPNVTSSDKPSLIDLLCLLPSAHCCLRGVGCICAVSFRCFPHQRNCVL